MNDHEAAGLKLAPEKSKNLPNRILRAFNNAKHLGGLKRTTRDVLAELCRFVPQNRAFEPVFVHKKTLAALIGMSERTLYRHLVILVEEKLIEILEQERRSRSGRFAVARIRLTRKAAILLGFIEAPEEFALIEPNDAVRVDPESDTPANPSAAVKPAGNYTAQQVIHTTPSAKISDRHMLSEPTISKNHPPQRFENGVPADLAWLSSSGMSRAGIFKLMGLAKARTKRLSDIVLAVRNRLRDIKGGRLYAYLLKLISGPSDFAMTAATERQRIVDAHAAKEDARKAYVFRERFRNVTLTNKKQNRLFIIDARAEFVQVFGGVVPTSCPLNDVRPWIEQIEKGLLILATYDLERRFAT